MDLGWYDRLRILNEPLNDERQHHGGAVGGGRAVLNYHNPALDSVFRLNRAADFLKV
jgi:hypothetical protein